MLSRPLLVLMALAALILPAPRALAADPREDGPKALIMTYRVAPDAKLAFRDAVRASTLPRLEALKASGALDDYHVLVSRYVDAQSWDMLVILDFHRPADLAHWRAVESLAPAGLAPGALKLVGEVESAPSDLMRVRTSATPPGEPAVYLIVPYNYVVSTDAYLAYVDGYVAPQTDGWLDAGAISGYDIYLPRYAAGRTWSSLLVLAYRGDAGLARRDAVVKAVRERLAASPDWKTFAEGKGKIRDEKVPMIADELRP